MRAEPAAPETPPAAAAGGTVAAPRVASQRPDPTRWHIEPAVESESEGWLISYLDVLTLLLVMLVVLLAFSPRIPLLPRPAVDGDAAADTTPGLAAAEVPAAADAPAADPLAGFDPALLGEGVEMIAGTDSVSFRINDAVLFASGDAELIEAGHQVLDRLVPVLASLPQHLIVEGHTDDQPIGTARYPSNWELSTARAARVVRYFEQRGIDRTRLRATGYADTRPIADNRDPLERRRNRRVDLVLSTAPAARRDAPATR